MSVSAEDVPRVALLPASLDLCDWAAQHIVRRHRDNAPDYTRVLVLLPDVRVIPRLRQRLRHHVGDALLGPTCTTLRGLAETRGESQPPLTPLQARLQLAEALEKFIHLFPGQDALTLAEELQGLLDQLTRHAEPLAKNPQEFRRRITKAYGAALKPLTQEAEIVDQLWRAYLQQTGSRSPALAEAQRLHTALAAIQPEETVYLVGFDDATPAELHALRHLLERGAYVWLQDKTLARQLGIAATAGPPPSARENTLNALFAGEPVTPDFSGLRTQPCTGPEQEARVAELAIRRWLLVGHRDIAVISNDRRYARRLRALLERAQVPLNDEAGWALSTSRAAASLTHWLDALEQDFQFRPLLDLLKSPFLTAAERLPAIHALEAKIYAQKQVSGLALLQLSTDTEAEKDLLESAARHWPRAGARLPLPRWSTALCDSLRQLPLWSAWQSDPAGAVLVETLEQLHEAAQDSVLTLDLQGFRILLDSLLESASFTPAAPRGPVRLLTLEQATLLRCETLLISGAAAGKFPANNNTPAYFNQSVRAELGLPHTAQQHALAFARFQRLLHAAPEVLITYAPEDEAQDAQPCAWLDYLQAYGLPDAKELSALAGSAAVEVAPHIQGLAPLTGAQALLPAGLFPAQLSASAHQSLINCPYQFYVRSGLQLQGPRAPDEAYSSSDYGQQAHRILHAFYHRVDGLPKPFGEKLTDDNRRQAEAQLHKIARAVFQPDLRERALARAWLAQFESAIRLLITRMAERQNDWPDVLAENWRTRPYAAGVTLAGRVDRLEANAQNEHSVVDYKTGAVPKKADVENGEDVQAVHYSLLLEHCVRAEYWPLSDDTSKKPVVVEGTELADLAAAVDARLRDTLTRIRDRAPLPAHGDATTCGRCEARGICREQSWT